MVFTPAFASSFLSWHAYMVSKENVENSKAYKEILFFFDIPYHIVQLNTGPEVNKIISEQELFTYVNPPAASIIAAQETLFRNIADAMSTGAFKVMPLEDCR